LSHCREVFLGGVVSSFLGQGDHLASRPLPRPELGGIEEICKNKHVYGESISDGHG